MVAQAREQGKQEWEVTANEHGVSFWGDEKYSKISVDGYTTL